MEAATTTGARDQSGNTIQGEEPGKVAYTLPAVLDLTEAQNLRDTMVALLNDRRLLLDASAVERTSTPGVQILLAAGRAADLANCPFQIIDSSEVFRTALADLGLQAEFKKWMV